MLDWHIPDFSGGKKKGIAAAQKNAVGESKKIVMSNQRLQLSCHMNTISMGELGEIGWYLKLEQVQDKNRFGNQQKRDKEREKVRQPLFQFRYDGKSGKYIRELKESMSVDNATKDPNFYTGFQTPMDNDLQFFCDDSVLANAAK